MWETSSAGIMRGTSSVGEMWGTSSVGIMRETSSVSEMRETSSAGEMWGTSSVAIPYSKTVDIKSLNNNATIKDLSGYKPKIIIASDAEFEIVKFVKSEELSK
jgi:hypothetical protein